MELALDIQSSSLPDSYKLSSFKSKVNKLDLNSSLFSIFSFLCKDFVYATRAFPQHNN